MPIKPATDTILTHYSYNDLIDLAKIKAKRDRQERLSGVQNILDELSAIVGGRKHSTVSSKSKTASKKSTVRKSKKRIFNKTPLNQHILNVLSSQSGSLSIADILKAVQANGYRTTSKKPRQIISMEILNLSKSGKIRKTGWGMYALKTSSVAKKASQKKVTAKKVKSKEVATKKSPVTKSKTTTKNSKTKPATTVKSKTFKSVPKQSKSKSKKPSKKK